MSPLLFLLYLNDLKGLLISGNVIGLSIVCKDIEKKLGILLKSFIVLYVDDTTILADNITNFKLHYLRNIAKLER